MTSSPQHMTNARHVSKEFQRRCSFLVEHARALRVNGDKCCTLVAVKHARAVPAPAWNGDQQVLLGKDLA
jgi:hypothetical protein